MIDTRIAGNLRWASLGLAVAFLGACDDSTGSPGDKLQQEDVVAVYRVCQLAFDPSGSTLPTVNILVEAFEYGSSNTDPTIGLDPNSQKTVELTYVPKGQVNDQELRGIYNIRSLTTVEIRFNTTGVNPSQFLIPPSRPLNFEWQESPRSLTMGASAEYTVSRAEYVALSGADPAGLADQIPGVLIAQFQVGSCST